MPNRGLDELSVSDGTGEAVVANIESDRAVSATTIDVDSVDNWPQKVILATGDKVLASNGNYYIDPATMTIMYGHLDSGDIIIDGFAPGYSDVGNTSGQIAIVKPNTYAMDEFVALVSVSLENDGTPKTTSLNPIGSIIDFAGAAAPDGWLLCYGQALDASVNTEYQALFDVIGNTYGGSDNTDFVIPDLRGRVVAGQDDMGGVSANRLTDQSGGVDGDVLGDTGGAETHTLVIAEMPAHTHGIDSDISDGSNARVRRGITNAAGTFQSRSEGGDGAHNNVQPTIILNKIIKY